MSPLCVGNIFPTEKSDLSIHEYNEVLDCFYEDIIKSYKENAKEVEIIGPTSNIFDPLSIMTQEELDKLELFCNAVNKTTGSTHPSDQERWFDFICLTVVNENVLDTSLLARFLQDESYLNILASGNHDSGVVETYIPDTETAFDWLNYHS